MATLVRNNTGSNVPVPATYGGGFLRMSQGVVINDALPNVALAFGAQPGDGLDIQIAPDNQLNSITPNLDPYGLLQRTPNSTVTGKVIETAVPSEGEAITKLP